MENKDFEDIVKIYDTPDTVFYIDPPYLEVKRVKEYYKCDFTMDNHIRLANVLNNIQGKAIVSYYPSETVKELYKGWNIIEVNISKFSHWQHGLEHRNRATEWLLYNFGGRCKKDTIEMKIEDYDEDSCGV